MSFFYNVIPDNFKLVLSFTFVLIFILNLINKNIFLTTFLVYLSSFPFLEPGKYFSFLVLEKGALKFEPLMDVGLIDAFGVTTSDILSFFLMLYLIRIFLHKIVKKQPILITNFDRIFSFSFIIYFLISMHSSIYYSFNPIFSLVQLFQYSKIAIVYVSTSYLLRSFKDGKKYLIYILLGILTFNLFLGFTQFFSGFTLTDESQRAKYSYNSPEDESPFPRPSGIFLHSNQFGLILLGLLISIYLLEHKKHKQILSLLVFMIILMTRSRTVWILLIPLFLFRLIKLFKNRKFSIKNLKFERKYFYFTFFSLLFFPFVLQRIYSTQFSFQGGSASIRIRMLNDGFDALNTSKYFGFGPATNAKAIYEIIPDSYVPEFPYPVHNGYLQISLESGIIAMIFFFLPFIYAFISSTMNTKKNWLFAYLIMSILVYYLIQPHAGRIEFSFLGIFLSLYEVVNLKNKKIE